VRLIDHGQRAVLARQRSQRVVIVGVGQDDAHIRHRRLGQHARDVTIGKRSLERVDVVELNRPRRDRRRSDG
jgi:hypothetical protein